MLLKKHDHILFYVLNSMQKNRVDVVLFRTVKKQAQTYILFSLFSVFLFSSQKKIIGEEVQLMYTVMNNHQTNTKTYRQAIHPPSYPQLNIQSYTIDYQRMIGRGNFSTVYAALNKNKPGIRMTVKVISLNSMREQKIQYLLRSEIDTLLSVHHQNVIGCRDIFLDDCWCYIFTDYCQGGTVEGRIKSKGVMSEKEALPIIKDVFEGLLYLEKNHIIHRDVKAANIFLNGKGRAVLADFGFARLINQPFHDLNIGSLPFMAPEAIIDSFYTQNTDVWGFGVFVYQLFHGESPYARSRTIEELKKNVRKPLDISQINSNLSIALKQLILSCLEINYEKRPKFADLKKSWFFAHLYPQKKSHDSKSKIARNCHSIDKSHTLRPHSKKVEFKKMLEEIQYCRSLFKLISRLCYENSQCRKEKFALYANHRILKLIEIIENDNINYGLGNHQTRRKKLKTVAQDYARQFQKQLRKKQISLEQEAPTDKDIHIELEETLKEANTMAVQTTALKQRVQLIKNIIRELLSAKDDDSAQKNYRSKFEM